MWLGRFGCGFPGIFGIGQAEIGHRAVVAGKRHAITLELRVFELTPHVELVLQAGLAFLLSPKPRRRGPRIGRR